MEDSADLGNPFSALYWPPMKILGFNGLAVRTDFLN